MYGQRARTAVASLTLFGGFARMVCWPLSALFVSDFGWLKASPIYAAIHVAVLLPLYVFALPTEPKRDLRTGLVSASDAGLSSHPAAATSTLVLGLVALVITINSMISAMLSVLLLTHRLLRIPQRELA